MFLGESIHTLDAKSRLVVPKRFLAEFPEDQEGRRNAMLTRGFEGCLFLFPEQGFERALERMQLQAFGGAELRTMQRLFFANVHRSPVDGSGRLLLPEKLRRLAGIEKEVVMVGLADRAEIWDRAEWERFESENDGQFDQLDVVLVGGAGRRAPSGADEG